ncbi:MAG: leucine-rich repeat protein [Bacteroidales bacterium]|jgi:hypothetical protein|nr:leucine-rich repeat protein [Bacteroidales bacterium]
MKKAFIIMVFAIFGLNTTKTMAHDFEAAYNGTTIYYKITSSSAPFTVEVTYKGNLWSDFFDEYSGNIIIPNTVTYNGNNYTVNAIGEYAFRSCEDVMSVTVPVSITLIGYGAFNGCTNLTSFIIPNSVTEISDYAFMYCSNITSISIPASVITIGSDVFYACTSLASIDVDINNPIYSSVEGIMYNKIQDTLLCCPQMKTGAIIIPASVKMINGNAFIDCTKLTSVVIGDSVTEIGLAAFQGCNGLTAITIPNSVVTVGSMAFESCSGLIDVSIGKGVTSLGDLVFYGCTSLTIINVDSNNNNYSSNEGILYNKIRDTLILCPQMKSGAITIPNTVLTIAYAAFAESAITLVTMNDSLLTIGEFAFANCIGLTDVQIPNLVNVIGDAAFQDCGNLSSVVIGSSVNSIGGSAFAGCTVLQNITSLAMNPPMVADWAFYDVPLNASIHVPCYSVSAYKSATQWSEFSNYTDCIGVNLNDFETTINMNIYPNPTNDKLFIEGNDFDKIIIYDLLGKMVLMSGKEKVIDVSKLARGIYNLQLITNEDAVVGIKKVVKQ